MIDMNTVFALMKRLVLPLIFAAASLSAQQAGDSPVKIFILAGQSNMVGHGEISPVGTQGTLEYIVANDPESEYQFLVDGVGDWVIRDDVWIRYQGASENPLQGGLTTGFGNSSSTIGPELGFGHKIGELNEQQVLLIKYAIGGKSLGNDFLPPSSGPYPEPAVDGDPGYHYKQIVDLVNDVTTNLSTYFPEYDGNGYELAGFGWHQGYNDRVDGTFSDAYEVNMVNFINDMRSDLGVADLPFVIATTGMGGGEAPEDYTTVELAQLAMADATAYPDFAGNVAVVDTRTAYEDLEFWQTSEFSPANQGYHWNRNAKTYLHIGLAMGDAMSILSPGRCPFRARSEGGPSGVVVSWQNGTETPTSVRILLNGAEIAAAAPIDPPFYNDSTALPGQLDYELEFTMPGDPCDPLSTSLYGGITGFDAAPSASGVELTWTNNMTYDAIEVSRDGVLLASISGTATSYTDTSPPETGLVTYSVVPSTGNSTEVSDQINFNLAGQLGILNPNLANGGINPVTGVAWAAGDTYRLVGTTVDRDSAPRSDSSADIATYNDWVNQQAATYSTVDTPWSDVTWYVIGSTPTVDARDNTGTNPNVETGSPILKFDGTTIVAADNADLWDQSIDAPIDIAFNGSAPSSNEINTGTARDGTASGTGSFGDGDPNADGKHGTGYANLSDGRWISGFARDYRSRHYFAISQVLTIQDTSSTGMTYDEWSSGPWDGTLTDTTTDVDFDGGGLETGIEWVVGGDPTLASDDSSVAPVSDNSDPTFFNFTYRISDDASADSNSTVLVEYGSDLTGWTTAVDNDSTIEITTTDGTGENEGFDLVTVQIDRSLAVGEKLFARLRVSAATP